jgi:hypothetical protein
MGACNTPMGMLASEEISIVYQLCQGFDRQWWNNIEQTDRYNEQHIL